MVKGEKTKRGYVKVQKIKSTRTSMKTPMEKMVSDDFAISIICLRFMNKYMYFPKI